MSQTFSASQLRAARALLDWSRADLAAQSGVSEPTIHRFENNMGEPELRTQAKIRHVFEAKGVEFLDNAGVRFKPEGLEVLKGAEGIRMFFDQVYSFAQTSGGVIRQNGIEDDTFYKYADEFSKAHRDRMNALRRARKNVLVRVLVQEGVLGFRCPEYAEYKWFPRGAPMPVPYYIFSDTVGIFAIDHNSIPKIYQITSPVIAATYIKQFDSAWTAAREPVRKR